MPRKATTSIWPPPRWTESGEPDNLPAAALDALEWLQFFEKQPLPVPVMSDTPDTVKRAMVARNRERLSRCIARLKGFLEEKV